MTAQSAGKPEDSPRRRPLPGRITVTSLKILLWIVLALLLTVSATLICTVRMLRPELLTPLVEAAAEKALDADLSLSRVEFKFRPEYRGLGIEIDSLLVISKVFDNLPPERRAALPVYADTLAGVESMTASISLPALLTGRIDLRDIVLRRPMLNIVLDGTGMNNFNIFTSDADSTDTDDDGRAALPDISVSRFALESPRAIRYFNAADSTDATILLLGGVDVANRPLPDYTLHVDGRLNSPMVRQLVAVDGISLGLDGRLVWTPRQPSLMAAEDIRLRVDTIEVQADAAVDFGEALIVNSARVSLQPVAVRELLRYVPDSLLRACSLTPPGFSTDASLTASVELSRPFNLDTDSIPYATASLQLSPSALRYGKARFDNVALDLQARLAGNNLDSATVEIRSFDVAGPATALTLRGTATALVSDPAFKVCLKGRSDLSKLPPVLTDAIGGTISGRVLADVDVDGRMSMLATNTFHMLKIDGSVDVGQLRYRSADTVTSALVENAALRFDSKRQFRRRDGSMSEKMLTTSLKIDTVSFLSDGMAVAASGIGLGLGAENSGCKIDSTIVLPMGGAVKVARLKVSSAADSAMLRLRGLGGFLSLRRFKGADKLPELIFRLNADRLAAGDPSTRLMLRKAQIAFTAHKKPARRRRIPADVRMAVDSISRVRPELSTDSVYRLAFAARRRHNQMRRQRAQGDGLTADEREIIDWGTSGAMRRFLLRWDFKGSVTTERGRLFTAYFPLRNKVRKLRIDFSTDSILLKGVEYSAGHSDMLVDGRISNIRRSFTGRGHRSPLKIDVKIQSDTIDVNELAASVFAGASYAEHLRRGGRSASFSAVDDDETELENSLETMVDEQSDSTGPLLVPTNIEADIDVKARNILYSNLAFTDFRGKLMVYDGAVNLHRLSARSDIGSIALGALYDAPSARSMKFGFGLNVKQLQLDRFLSLMPAVDSIVPMMRNFSGIINANVAATADIDENMNLVMPSLNAAVGLSGDSLRIIDPETYRMIGKWLLFKDKKNDRIKHMNVEFIVEDNMLRLYPFTFDIDRYRLGVQGYNDLALNFNYHVSVLKSPLPFKFGITVKGTPDDYKIRIGRAKFKEGAVAEQRAVVDTVRVNLITQIENVFRRGVSRSKFATVNVGRRPPRMSSADDSAADTLSRADSIALIREGIIPGKLPVDTIADTPQALQPEKGKKTQKKKKSRR